MRSGLHTKPNQRPKGNITWGGPTSDEIPSSVCKTEFVWDYNGSLRPMEFIAGNVGITQDKENLTLRPYVGWAVREADKEST